MNIRADLRATPNMKNTKFLEDGYNPVDDDEICDS
jgi:hypothetical protein